VVIALVIAGTIFGGLFGSHAHGHNVGFLIPVFILGLVFLRLTRTARRGGRGR